MTTESSGSKATSTADSYIGSLISLTSKSEIRYEGVLYNINTEESSIGLKNVRSFGTEGRKKDGPQVLPSDKVYEYILFRGSDIKDLQVKSSPPVQPTPAINNDPAIIQSHYSRPLSTPTNLPSAATGPLTDMSPHNAQLGLPGSNFQGGLPLYQPGGSLGSWGASPAPPNANGSNLAMPMYWHSYYGPPSGLPHMHQQTLLRPPPGLSMPPPMQQPLQYPNFNSALPPGPSGLQSLSLTEAPSPLLSSSINSSAITSTGLPSSLSSTLPLAPAASLASETLPSSLPSITPNPLLTPTVGNSLSSLSFLTTAPEMNSSLLSISDKPNVISGPTLPFQSASQSASLTVGISNPNRTEAPMPSLVTPGQLLQSGPSLVPSSQAAPVAAKDVEVVPVFTSTVSEPPATAVTEGQPPILPLPVTSRAAPKPNEAPYHNRHAYRGRERGRGSAISHPVTKFTEDFDFMAMNEKFKKDEVWGHLGKSSKSHSKEREGAANYESASEDDEDDEVPKIDVKPVYNKDDFFDTLSGNSLNNDPQNGRTRFSEQRKIDTETFGDFNRHRGGRGGRGFPRGGRSRGGYYGYGRGYGYGGRGRGRGMPSRDL